MTRVCSVAGAGTPASPRRGPSRPRTGRRGRIASSLVHVVLHRHDRPPWTVITVSGDLDVAGAPELRQEVVAAVAEGRVRLVLDMTGVEFIDSFGIGVVVGALKRVRQRDGELAVVCPEPRVRRVFELCDIDRILTLHSHVDEALDSTGATS